MFQKLIDQKVNTYTIPAGGVSPMICNAEWLFQPLQGKLAGQMANGGSAQWVIDGVVNFEVQAGNSKTNLGYLQAISTITTQGIQGEDSRYATTHDYSTYMVSNDGSITVVADHMPLCQIGLTLYNWSGSPLTVQVKTSVFGDFLPHPASAEVQDAFGAGRGSAIPYPNVPSPVSTTIPGHRQFPACKDGTNSLPAAFPDDPAAVEGM